MSKFLAEFHKMINSIAIIFLFGFLVKELFKKLKIPYIIGLIFLGIIINPANLNLLSPSLLNISADLRKIALVIILIRAGLNLAVDDFKKVGLPTLLLSFVPATCEIIGWLCLAPLFMEITFFDSLILASVLAAISPAIIVPSMLALLQQKIGTDKKIPQMLLTGASFEDIFVVILFTTLISIKTANIFHFSLLIKILLSIPLSIIIALAVYYLLRKILMYSKYNTSNSLLLILGSAFFLVELENILANYLFFSSLLSIFILALLLKKSIVEVNPQIVHTLADIWWVAELFLFVLLGANVNFAFLPGFIFSAVILISFGIFFRIAGVFLSLAKSELNLKEKMFCAAAYIPKATVQATIGSIPLSLGVQSGDKILLLSVLIIFITAPLGSFFLEYSAPKLLKNNNRLQS